MPTKVAGPLPAQKWKRNKQLAAKFGISAFSLSRWKKDPTLNTPPPAIINGIEYNDDEKWEAWMQERTLPLAQQVEISRKNLSKRKHK